MWLWEYACVAFVCLLYPIESAEHIIRYYLWVSFRLAPIYTFYNVAGAGAGAVLMRSSCHFRSAYPLQLSNIVFFFSCCFLIYISHSSSVLLLVFRKDYLLYLYTSTSCNIVYFIIFFERQSGAQKKRNVFTMMPCTSAIYGQLCYTKRHSLSLCHSLPITPRHYPNVM